MTDQPLDHPSNEEAAQTIDAMVFTGCPEGHELDRLEYFCRRWLKEIKSHRETNAELESEGEIATRPKRIEVGTLAMREAFESGVENYLPTAGGHLLQEEGGVTHVSTANLKEMVDLQEGRFPIALEVGPKQGMLFSWPGFETYLATGFSIGYRGTGPHGLAKFCEACGWGEREGLLIEIAALCQTFEGILFPRKARKP